MINVWYVLAVIATIWAFCNTIQACKYMTTTHGIKEGTAMLVESIGLIIILTAIWWKPS